MRYLYSEGSEGCIINVLPDTLQISLIEYDISLSPEKVAEINIPLPKMSFDDSTDEGIDKLVSLLEAIARKEYPHPTQAKILEKLKLQPLIWKALQNMCASSTCICPLFYIGCVDLDSTQTKLSQSKLVRYLTRILSPYVDASILLRARPLDEREE